MSPRAVTLGPWAQIWAWAPPTKYVFGARRGPPHAIWHILWNLGPGQFLTFSKKFLPYNSPPTSQFAGKPLVKNIRHTRENPPKPFKKTFPGTTHQNHKANLQNLEAFFDTFLALQHHNLQAATLNPHAVGARIKCHPGSQNYPDKVFSPSARPPMDNSRMLIGTRKKWII